MNTKQVLGLVVGGSKGIAVLIVAAVFLLGERAGAAPIATATWYGTVNSSWNNPTNWTPSWDIPGSIQPVPTATTSVTIPTGDSNYPVLTNNVTIGALSIIQGAGSFTITNSTLTVGSGGITALTGSTFNVNTGGSIVSTGTVVIGGNFTVNGSITGPVTVYNTSTFTINSNATVNTSVGGFNANAGGGNVYIYGTLNDGTNALTDNTTIALTGGTFITGPIALIDVNLAVTAGNLTCGGITFDNGGTLTVNGAATVTSTGAWNFFGGYTTINSGNFNFSGGTQSIPSGTYTSLNLNGGGTLTLTGGSVSSNLTIAANTVAGLTTGLNIPVGTLTLGTAGQINGTWGSTSSTAANKSNTYFSGPGILTVSNNAAAVPTTTTLSALTTATYGNNAVWTATVTPTPAGGTVQFQTNGVAIGKAVPLVAGKASITNSLAAGTYAVTAAYSGTNTAAASTSASANQLVNPVTVTIASGLTANNKPYDTTTAATLSASSVVLSGVLAGDTANVQLSTNGYTATFASANAANGTGVTVSGLTLTGSAAGNYTLTQPTGLTANITAVSVTIASGITANNKIYNGTTTATINSNNVVLNGVLAGDAANVHLGTNGYSASFTSANVANGVAVTVSGLTLTGSAAGNYTLTQPAGLTGNLTAATVTVASGITANNKTYTGTTAATISSNSVVLSGVVSGDTANVHLSTNGYTATFASANVANGLTVTVSGLTLTGSAAGNYTLTQPAGLTGNITAATVTIASGITANNKTYTGTTAATISSNNVVLVGVVAADLANVSLATNSYTATFASANVANGISVTVSGLTLTGSAAGNYTLTQPAGLTGNITAATVTIASGLSAGNKVYNGTATATISSNNVTLTGVVAADTANVHLSTNGYTASFGSAGVVNGGAVTVSGLTLAGSAAGNYSLTQPAGLTANITAAPVTIVSGITANNKAYDTTATATISSNNVVLNGVIAGDIANVVLSTNGYSATFGSASVTNGASVTVSGLTLTGSAAGNYTLTQPTGLTANITAASVTIASGITANNKIYNGTAATTINSNNVVLNGVLAGDAANVALSTNGYSAVFAAASVTNGASVTVSGLTLTGRAAGNYTLTQPAGLTANITAATVTIASGLTANNKVYDGSAAATISSNNVVLNGVIGGDTANVSLSTSVYVASFASTNVANGVAVTVSGLTLTGSAAGNYTLTQPAGLTANITAAAWTINYNSLTNPLATSGTIAWAIDGTNIVGNYTDGTGNHGFLDQGGSFSPVNDPLASSAGTSPRGISGNEVVGQYYAGAATTTACGFVYNISAATFTTLNDPLGTNGSYAMGIEGTNIVGYYNTATGSHGYFYNGSTFQTLNDPVANNITYPRAISGNNIVGYFTDAAGLNHGFIYSLTNGVYTTMDDPEATRGTFTRSISGKFIVGYFTDGLGNHGFLYTGSNYITLNHPAAPNNTYLYGISGATVVGYYTDAAGNHAFSADVTSALPPPATTTNTLTAPTPATYGNGVVWTTTVTPVPNGGTVQFETNGIALGTPVALTAGTAAYTNSLLPAGTYTVSAIYSGTLTYAAATAAAVVQVVSPAAVSVTSGITANSKAYDGVTSATLSSNNVVLNGVIPGDITNVQLSTNGYAATFASASVANGATVTVSGLTLTGSAAANYTLTQPAGLTANITAVPVSITSGITANNKVYNGTTSATLSANSVVLNGVVSGDTANIHVATNGYTATFASAGVANGIAVTVSGLTLTGSAAANYTLTQPASLTANITPAPVTVTSGIVAKNKVYDGKATATISSNNVVLNGVVTGDVASVRLSTNGYAATFASVNVANGLAVTVSGLTLTGSAAGNYTLTQPANLTANLTAAPVTITTGVTANNKGYDGTTAATISSNSVVLSGVLPADTANVSLSTNGYVATFASAVPALGVHVTVTGLTLVGSAAANYSLTQPAALTANITQTTVAFSTPTNGQSVVNSTLTVAVTGTTTGNIAVTNVWLSQDGINWTNATTANQWTNWNITLPVSAGTQTIYAYAVDAAGNVSVTNQLSFTYIQTAPLTVLTTGQGTVSPNDNGQLLQIGTAYTLTATGTNGFAFTNWTSNLLPTTTAATLNFTMASNLVLTANFADVTPPTVRIVSPSTNQTVYADSGSVLVTGTAADNAAVTNVWVSMNGTNWTTATTTNNWANWTANLPTTDGKRTVYAYAVDGAGNHSVTNKMAFTYTLTATLTVIINGQGSVKTNYNGMELIVGDVYTMTATASNGWAFVNWTANLTPTTNSASQTNLVSLNFQMVSNLVLIANFVNTLIPNVTVLTPTNNQVILNSNGVVTVTGTVTDRNPITNVWLSLDYTNWTTATTRNQWTNWTAALPMLTGAKTLYVYAVDKAGNRSAAISVPFTYYLTSQFGLTANGGGAVGPNGYNGNQLVIGGLYTVTATNQNGWAFTGWSSNLPLNTNSTPLTNDATLTFIMMTNLSLTANFVYTNLPTLSVTNLVSGQVVTNSALLVLGKAADPASLASVSYALNGGGWLTANGTTNWSASVSLTPGTNVITAFATGNSGGYNSLISTTKVMYAVSSPLTVVTNGLGSIKLPAVTNYYIGENYTLNGTAAKGFVLTNWTTSIGGGTNSGTFTFTMTGGLVVAANFADTQSPTLVVSSPNSTITVTNEYLTVTGHAYDNWAIGGVYCQVNGGGLNLATTTNGYTNWTATVQLAPGTNLITTFAADIANEVPGQPINYSATNSVTVIFSTAPASLVNTLAQVTLADGTPMEMGFGSGVFSQFAWSTNNADAAGTYTATNVNPYTILLTLNASAFPDDLYAQTVQLTFTNRYQAWFTYTNQAGDLLAATASFGPAMNVNLSNPEWSQLVSVNTSGLVVSNYFIANSQERVTGNGSLTTNLYSYQTYGPCGSVLVTTNGGTTTWTLFQFENNKAAKYFSIDSTGATDIGLTGFTLTGTNAVAPASVSNRTLLFNTGWTLGTLACTTNQFVLTTSDNTTSGSGNYTYSLLNTNTASLILNYSNPGYTNTETHVIGFLNPNFGITTNGGNVFGVIVQ